MTQPDHTDPSLQAPALTPLERAAGLAIGTQDEPTDWGDVPRHASPRQALEAVIARHLRAGPVTVTFSGGRDSSAILALAVHVARQQTLPLPVPATFRFADVPMTHESEWQELVIEHLGLTEWVHVALTDELDLLGQTARHCLQTFGLAWPANTYLHEPMFKLARGGTVLTGFDGDGLFGEWRWGYAQMVLHARVRPHPRDVSRVGLALAPQSVRRRALAKRGLHVPSWLRPAAAQAYLEATLRHAASEPRRWDRRVQWHARSRSLYLLRANLALIAGEYDVTVAHPLLEPEVLASLAAAGGAGGLGDRTSIMGALVGDLLPEPVLARATKAVFGGVVWREQALAFARQWDGGGVDPELVDVELLRQAWLSEHPSFDSWAILQDAWLASQPKGTQSKQSSSRAQNEPS